MRRICVLAAALLGPISAHPADRSPALEPFLATYVVDYRGLQAGTSTLELRKVEDGPLTYSSRSNASGLFRLVQDVMSAQVALMWDALRGESPKPYFLADKTELKAYTTLYQGDARVATALGELDTAVLVTRRPGAKRSPRVWLAPSLGFVPVQAEQMRASRRVWIMRIASWGSRP